MPVEAAHESDRLAPGGPDAAGGDALNESELPEAPTAAYVPAPDALPSSDEVPRAVPSSDVPPSEDEDADDDPFGAAMDLPLIDQPDAPPDQPGGSSDQPDASQRTALATVVPESPVLSESPDGSESADLSESRDVSESPEPAVRRRGSSRRFLALSVTFAALLALLTYTGYRSSLRMTGGASISPQQRSPDQPGYEAAVKPTPVTFLAMVTDDGGLRSLSVVAQGTGESGGTIVTIPLSLFLENADGEMRIPNYIEAEDGMDELQSELEAALGFGMTEQLVVTQSDVDAMIGGQPLAIRNPEQLLVNFQGVLTPQFESGNISLDPDGLMAYLNYLGAEESEYNRLNRQQLVLEQLLALSVEGFDVAGESEDVTVLADLFSAVGSGDANVTQLPVTEARIGGRKDGGEGQGTSFTAPDTEAIDATLGDIIPFPISGFPGQRLGVKLLNGTTAPQLELRMAAAVVGAGAEVKVVGNAKQLDQAASTVAVSIDATEEERAQAQRVADALDAELTETDKLGEEVRAVVVVGQDLS